MWVGTIYVGMGNLCKLEQFVDLGNLCECEMGQPMQVVRYVYPSPCNNFASICGTIQTTDVR